MSYSRSDWLVRKGVGSFLPVRIAKDLLKNWRTYALTITRGHPLHCVARLHSEFESSCCPELTHRWSRSPREPSQCMSALWSCCRVSFGSNGEAPRVQTQIIDCSGDTPSHFQRSSAHSRRYAHSHGDVIMDSSEHFNETITDASPHDQSLVTNTNNSSSGVNDSSASTTALPPQSILHPPSPRSPSPRSPKSALVTSRWVHDMSLRGHVLHQKWIHVQKISMYVYMYV